MASRADLPSSPGGQMISPLFMDLAAERALLGALLSRGRREDFAALDRDEFAEPHHTLVFEAIRAVIDRDGNADVVRVAHELQGTDVPLTLVADCVEQDGGHVSALVQILHELRQRRWLDAFAVTLSRHTR